MAGRSMVDESTSALSQSLVGEVFKAIGLPEAGQARRIFGRLLLRATDRLSVIGLTFDRMCADQGFSAAAEWALGNWCRGVRASSGSVPSGVPLLVISNHPGTYDALVIASHLQRDDLVILVSDIPFLKKLPHAREHFAFLDMDPQSRACALRCGVRHLERGGAVLLYGTGRIDPDPAISDEAAVHIERWSPSIEVFLRLVPQARVVLSVVSHAVSSRWARSPIAWLRRDAMDQRRLVEFAQVLQQLFFPGSLYLSPCLSLEAPADAPPSNSTAAKGELLGWLIGCEKRLMDDHLARFGASFRLAGMPG
jgi:hypothetical protein